MMTSHFCNPLNVPYHYQFMPDPQSGAVSVYREAADPSIIFYQGRYWLFASMNLSVWVSDDLIRWESKPLPPCLPLYGYAPDACVINGAVYITACDINGENGAFYRTQDILNGPYERIEMPFSYKDPNLFQDTDGRLYFYWGCSAEMPIQGVELNRETMQPLNKPIPLIYSDAFSKGFERVGEDNSILPLSDEIVEAQISTMLASQGQKPEDLPPVMRAVIRSYLKHSPYIEGAWMTKHQGRYYLQYAFSGTENNVYGDAVYVSNSPLGPFSLAENNPYSYAPGSFLPGAGHGSTFKDRFGNWWHAATMRVSVNHNFERRVGLWPAGFDAEGELFCNQCYHDWPRRIPSGPDNPWAEPDWLLLSVGKSVAASSFTEGHEPSCAAVENVQTWWQAASSQPGEWLELDLCQEMTVHVVQINFADDKPAPSMPEGWDGKSRYIDTALGAAQWTLEGAGPDRAFRTLADKSETSADLPHDCLIWEDGVPLRYLRLTIHKMPYGQRPCVSGLRVFGRGAGELPAVPQFQAKRTGSLDMEVAIDSTGALGYNVLWGHASDKLYHSRLTYVPQQRIGALVKDQDYYVRVDAFNENGIVHGETVYIPADIGGTEP